MTKRSLTDEELSAVCLWASGLDDLLTDACNLLWPTYGVSSTVGKRIERVWYRAQHLATVRIGDMAEHLPDEATGQLCSRRADPNPGRPNRFSIPDRGISKRLPKRMPIETHRALGLALRRARANGQTLLIRCSRAVGTSHQLIKDMCRVIGGVDCVRSWLDGHVGAEGLGLSVTDLNGLYYGDGTQAEARAALAESEAAG